MVRADLDVVVTEDNVEVLAAGDVLAGEGQASGDKGGGGSHGGDQRGSDLHFGG